MRSKFFVSVILAVLLCAGTGTLRAQRSEIGVGAGVSFYLGDLNPKKVFYDSRACASIFYRYNINTRWAFRFSGSYGRIMANDADFDNPRNLNFRNDLGEIAAIMEVNFVNFFTGSEQHRFTPYLAFGAALCFSNPQGLYLDEPSGTSRWVALRPLHTEGQGLSQYGVKEYSLAQFAIPFGLGFKVSISERVALGVEWLMRWTVTDYLDDVSGNYADPGVLMSEYGPESAYFADPSGSYHKVGAQRGDKSLFDFYSFTQFTISIRLGGRDYLCPAYSGLKNTHKQ
ncbi:MAG: outer membrane beta-barrel protein [Bacteroidales bacterium]|nr:outer membrane beta-barrel protein [Bacteroidales bacterium]